MYFIFMLFLKKKKVKKRRLSALYRKFYFDNLILYEKNSVKIHVLFSTFPCFLIGLIISNPQSVIPLHISALSHSSLILCMVFQ